jgi:CheY-like chemotaxis protein
MKNKINIGIFEDDAIDRFIYDRVLNKLSDHITYTIFDSVESACELVQQQQFDMIMVNYHYKSSRVGITIMNRLREVSSKHFVAIAVTPMLQKDDVELIIESGFSRIMEMPLLFEKIHDLICPLIDSRDIKEVDGFEKGTNAYANN